MPKVNIFNAIKTFVASILLSAVSLLGSPTPTPTPILVDCVINSVPIKATKAKCDEWVNYLKTLPTPTPTSKKSTYVAPVVDSDPPVHCPIHANCGGGSTPLRKSECENSICCTSNGKSVFYKDKSQSPCANTQQRAAPVTIPTYTNTYVDNSVPCFISYPCTGNSYTYRLLPADCTNAQQQARNLCNTSNGNTAPIATPTLTDSQAQSIIDQHNSQVKQCRSNVVNQYAPLIQGCNIRFGDSSAAEACVKIYSDDRQNAYNACGNTY